MATETGLPSERNVVIVQGLGCSSFWRTLSGNGGLATGDLRRAVLRGGAYVDIVPGRTRRPTPLEDL
ncbi:hypothetical protein GCM10009815_34420 [Nocardioides marmoribigeumensis]